MNQEDNNEDLSFSKNDIDIHTPFINPANNTHAEADNSFVEPPVKKSVPKARGKPAPATKAIDKTVTIIPLEKRTTNENKDEPDAMVLRKKKVMLKKRVTCDDQTDSDIIAAPKKKIRAQTRAAAKETTSSA